MIFVGVLKGMVLTTQAVTQGGSTNGWGKVTSIIPLTDEAKVSSITPICIIQSPGTRLVCPGADQSRASDT